MQPYFHKPLYRQHYTIRHEPSYTLQFIFGSAFRDSTTEQCHFTTVLNLFHFILNRAAVVSWITYKITNPGIARSILRFPGLSDET